MPESPSPKLREAPPPNGPAAKSPLAYAELDVKSNYSFLRGASHPDELVYRAAELGYRAIGVTDFNSLAGVVRAHQAAKEAQIKLLVGARLRFSDAPDLLVWAPDRAAYGRLCRLLTLGKCRAEKGECMLVLEDFLKESEGLIAAAVMTPMAMENLEFEISSLPLPRSTGGGDKAFPSISRRNSPVARLRDTLGPRLSLAVSCGYGPDDATYLSQAIRLGKNLGIPLLATNDVYYHDPSRRSLQDALVCIHHGCTIHDAGYRLFPNGERYLKSPEQMYRLFADHPRALRRGVEIAEACNFSLDSLRYEYPDEVVPADKSPLQHLADLTWRGAADRYPQGIPDKVRRLIEHELKLIEQLHFEHYFLTVHDLVCFARSRGILCQGRGSAANSAVCYCIGVTSVDPERIDVLFERFISSARGEPPDIDIDFEHERREEVIQYVYEKYGRDRAGMTAEVITYRGRSAVRDIGKAMGLSLDMVDALASKLDWWHSGTISDAQVRECGLDPTDRITKLVIDLTSQLLGFPRHLSQHVGGLVMTKGPLNEMVPIENASMPDRTVIEWDKDDIDALGILKVDVLALGMLTCISKAFAMLDQSASCGTGFQPVQAALNEELSESSHRSHGLETRATSRRLELHTVPAEDPIVYDMICNADTIGVFQIESRAQMSMLPRLRPRCFYDLVIEVAIVRPGPIQGDMVHPYLRRRNKQEVVEYPSEELRQVLSKTLGVPLFQEQAMRLVMVAAGFSAEQADKLRRAMAAWRRNGLLEQFHPRVVGGMLEKGYTREFAERCFLQIKGFGEYGFPESHAASFALLVYASAWLKCHHPAAFAAALLNSQPMGFYAPAQIVRDAREHDVEVRPADVNFSAWDCGLEFLPLPPRERAGVRVESLDQSTGSDSADLNPHLKVEPLGQPTPSDSANFHPHPSPLPEREREQRTMRLGLRLLRGFREAHAKQLVAARDRCKRFDSIAQLHRLTHLPVSALRILAEADAFGSLGLSRRQALWEVTALKDQDYPLFEKMDDEKGDTAPSDAEKGDTAQKGDAASFAPISERPVYLPKMPLGQEVSIDYSTTSLSLKEHPVALVRAELSQQRILSSREMLKKEHGDWVKVAGLVLVRQRPGTASGVVFVTLEDETGLVNLILHATIYERYRAPARQARLLQADGYVQREGQVVHVLAKRLFDLSDLLADLEVKSRDFH
ncbi:MAG TPA: error-prone DNA polymerase [Humisphaera sp.]|jgi:error-prone DNA polymerase|nr:error-prone DNA polymerase [Humisphaera sp.]